MDNDRQLLGKEDQSDTAQSHGQNSAAATSTSQLSESILLPQLQHVDLQNVEQVGSVMAQWVLSWHSGF